MLFRSVYQLTALNYRPSSAQRAILQDISLSFHAGEQVAIIGPSGAGNTSLLAVLALAIKAKAEAKTNAETPSFTVLGVNPWADNTSAHALHSIRKRVFYAPQTPPLPPRQRVIHTVLAGLLPHWGFWRSLRSLIKPSVVDAHKAYDALSALSLGEKLWQRVDQLSGGERQRVGLARLLVSDTAVFLVDEPLSALDPHLAAQAISVLQAQARTRGALLICSLHQVALARSQFARVVGMREGRVAFDLPAHQVSDAMIDALYAGEKLAGEKLAG